MAYEQKQVNSRRGDRRASRRKAGSSRTTAVAKLAAAGIAMVLCGAMLLSGGIGLLVRSFSSQETPTEPSTPQDTPAAPSTVIHLAAAGDLNVTDGTVASGNRTGIYDYSSVFLDTASVLSGADLTVMNFEGNLVGAPYGGANVSAPQQMVQALAEVGVDLLQAANSWSIKNGILGLESTLSGIRSAGMEPLGAYASAEDFQKSGGYYICQVNGVRIAFVAFTKGMGNMGLPAGSEDCVNLLYTDYSTGYKQVDKDGITQVLRRVAQQQPDLTVALLHWGSEHNDNISSSQRTIINLMAKEGVDAIIGSHSHRVQQAGFDPDTGIFVAYSLGDFFGDAARPHTAYSVILDLEITKNNTTGQTAITGYSYTPIYTVTDPETGLPVKVLRIREAIEAYQASFVGMVDEATYNSMVAALASVENRIQGK